MNTLYLVFFLLFLGFYLVLFLVLLFSNRLDRRNKRASDRTDGSYKEEALPQRF